MYMRDGDGTGSPGKPARDVRLLLLYYVVKGNMTVVILVGNEIDFAITAGLIIGYICPVASNLVCNEGERVSPYSQCRSLAQILGDSTKHWCQKEHHNCQLSSQIRCVYVLLW